MSESQDDGGPGQREVAYRLFAAEFDDADFSYSESDEERAPNYVITPTGARANRVFVVGVLTEVEQVGDDVLRARVVDPTGAFVLYAGQYQPDEMAFLDRAETPSFVAVTGKARTFQPEDSDAVYTSIRPESISTVDAATRDRWTVQTAKQTIGRIGHMATALSLDVHGDALTETLLDHGVSESLAHGIPLAIDHYGTTPAYLSALRETALDAARVVSGDMDEVAAHSVAPDAPGEADLSALVDTSVEVTEVTETATEPATAEPDEPTPTDESESESPTEAAAETQTEEPAAEPDDSETESMASEATESVADAEPEPEPAVETTTNDESVEPTAESEAEPEVLGESGADADDEDLGDFDPGEFELDDDEREEIEAEYGTEFQSGTEVSEPGEADIDTPDPEELADAEAESQPTSDTETVAADSGASSEPATEEPASAEDEQESEATEDAAEADDVDLDDVLVDVMEELDDGDGAERSALVETLTDRYGVSDAEVEDAIQDALMSGQCYEPDDTTLKSI